MQNIYCVTVCAGWKLVALDNKPTLPLSLAYIEPLIMQSFKRLVVNQTLD